MLSAADHLAAGGRVFIAHVQNEFCPFRLGGVLSITVNPAYFAQYNRMNIRTNGSVFKTFALSTDIL
jgi:hypothetical protein